MGEIKSRRSVFFVAMVLCFIIAGLSLSGVILPGDIAGSEASLRWLVGEISPEIAISIMSQYYPAHQASKYSLLNRRISPQEYAAVVKLVEELSIVNGWMQGMESPDNYLPDFRSENSPFSVEKP